MSRSEQSLRAMPVKQTGLPVQPLALEVSLKAITEAVTQQTVFLQQVLEKIGQPSTRQQKGCLKCGGSHMQWDCPQGSKQQLTTQSNSGGKQRRSGTGVSSPVSRFQVSKRANSEPLAVLDKQDGRTTVKRKQRDKRKKIRQSEKLIENKPAQEMPGPGSQPVETEAQSVEPLNTFQITPHPTQTTLQKHPSRRQCSKKLCQEQKEVEAT